MNRIIRTSTTAAPGAIAVHGATGVIRALASVSLAALLIIAPSCRKGTPEQGPIHVTKGGTVLFSGAIGGSESGTKTAYAGDNASDRSKAESILWQTGDEIRIWCAECSAPTAEDYGGADHWADYTVTPDETNKNKAKNKAKIATRTGTVGLRWSEAEPMPTHYFYAVSPSPRTSGKSGETGTLGTTAAGTPTPFTFTGIIPATQAISGSPTTGEDPSDETKQLTIASPDMANLYMVSKAKAKPVTETGTKAGEENSVFLNFRPISTAIEFTIENAMTADDAKMYVESVKIMSDPKTGTPKNLSGAFVADLASTWTKPKISDVPAGSGIISTYQNDYPTCTEPSDKSGQTNAVSIDFTGTTAYTEGIAKGNRLRFTFFLLPTQSVNDLSFVITRKDGEGTKTIKTRLAMADGKGIPFPVHKKTYVKGILVPDSAQWTIQYTVDVVTPWGDNPEDIPFYYPDMQEITTVTPWTEVPCNPGFEKQNN